MDTREQIREQIDEALSSVSDWQNLGDFIPQFHLLWVELGQKIQQSLVQQKIEVK